MVSENEKLYEKAMDAIRELFSDRSVSQGETIVQLNGLKEEIGVMVDTLDADDDYFLDDMGWDKPDCMP